MSGDLKSGREDLNLRPLAPHASALHRTAPRPELVHDYTIVWSSIKELFTSPAHTRRKSARKLPVPLPSTPSIPVLSTRQALLHSSAPEDPFPKPAIHAEHQVVLHPAANGRAALRM